MLGIVITERKTTFTTENPSDLTNLGTADVEQNNAALPTVKPTVEGDTVSFSNFVAPLDTSTAVDYVTNIPDIRPIDDIFARPTSIVLALGVTGGATATFNPWNLWRVVPAVSRKLANVVSFRGKMRIRFEVDCRPIDYGLFVTYITPSSFGAGPAYTLHGLSGGSYFRTMDVSKAAPLEYVLGFNNYTPSQDVAANGMLQFTYNLVHLGASDGAASASIRVYCSFEDVELIGITPQSDKAKMTRVKEPRKQKADDEAPKFSSALDSISKAANTVSNIPFIGPMATTVGAAAAMGSKLASLFGFTRETVANQPMPVFVSRGAPSAMSEEKVYTHICDLAPSNKPVSREAYLNEEFLDEESLDYLHRRWSWHTYYLKASGSIGVIQDVPINPGTCIIAANAYTMDTLAATTIPFVHWRGSIEYRLSIYCSQFTRGKIRMVWYKSTITENPDNVAHCVYLDVCQGAVADISIPYVSSEPWSNVWIQDIATPAWTTMGFLRIEIVAPIIQPAACDTVFITLSRRGGPDYRVADPGSVLAMCRTDPYVAQTVSVWGANAKYTPAAAGNFNPAYSPQSDDAPLVATTVGTIAKSLRQISQRPTLAKVHHTNMAAGYYNVCSLAHNAYPDNANLTTNFQYVNNLYLFRSGSTRWTVQCRDTQGTPILPGHFKLAYDASAPTMYNFAQVSAYNDRLTQLFHRYAGTGLSFFEANTVATGELPTKKFLNTRSTYGEAVDISMVAPYGTADNDVTTEFFQSAGMDHRNFVYLGPPTLYFWVPV